MRVITLAAGIGSRLSPALDEPIPKALVPVGDETLIERQARQLDFPRQTGHVAVVGQQGECWTSETVDRVRTFVDDVVINERNAETEASYSFLLGLESVPAGEDLLVVDGDIALDDHVVATLLEHDAANVALVKAVGTRSGVNRGACVEYRDGTLARCSFDVETPYVYSGVMKLSASTVSMLESVSTADYQQEQLATLIDELSRSIDLKAVTINPETDSVPVVEETLDGYEGTGKTTVKRRKGNVEKTSLSGSKKLRDEVEIVRYGKARHPDHFPEILEVDFFADEPVYEMPDYTQQGYRPLDELIRSGLAPDELVELAEPPIEFVLEEFGHRGPPLPGLYRNAFLPKIRSRYATIDESSRIDTVRGAETLLVNGEVVPGFATIVDVLAADAEFVGRLEPRYVTEIHGDFKPDNVLIDEDTGEFILLDPRGRSEIGTATHDSVYDVAKFLTSVRGRYTACKHGDFDLTVSGSGPEVTVEYEFEGPLESYDRLAETALRCVKSTVDDSDTDWNVRIHALAGFLMIANAPVHVSANGADRMATMILIRGLELVKRALSEFTSRTDTTGNVVNVNTEDDLALAERLFAD